MPCGKCGASDAAPIDLLDNEADAVIGVGFLCAPCMSICLMMYGELRRQFDGLVAEGVDRAVANRIMNVRAERLMG